MKMTYFMMINCIILLTMPFIMSGIIKKTKAFWAGRKGVCLLQPFYDFVRLMKKESVYSNTTSFIFKITPIISFAAVFVASFFVPMLGGFCIDIPFGFIFFAYILGLAKFFSILSAMDTGSSFEGMGASREACFTALVEPAFFIMLAAICAVSGSFSFTSLNTLIVSKDILGFCIVVLAVVALLIMLLIECSRVPVDDPNTHLELTMIHEVMILDNSGRELALLTYVAGMKMVLISSLICTLLIPFSLPLWLNALLYLTVLSLIAVLIGTLESGMARFRMSHIFEFVFSMTAIALVILALVTIKVYGG